MNKHYHLIGIGGIGMSGIARLLMRRGVRVSGSDLNENRITAGLAAEGARIFTGHKAENTAGADVVVYSSAIGQDNPEIIEAKRRGVPLIKRAEALAELMEGKTVVTVTGSHGKTTTTSLVSCLLIEAGLFPTVAIGGILKNIGNNACLGAGEFFVAEADESDGSFLYYRPRYSVITNIDAEHLDYYKDFESELAAFRQFIGRTQEAGCVFACSDDRNLKRLLGDYANRRVLFGLNEDADIYPVNVSVKGLSSEFDCLFRKKRIGRFRLALGGMHNVSNSLSVIALGLELGIDIKVIGRALAEYKGAGRRLEVKLRNKDYQVIDDYAHHPTEIKATLSAVKSLEYDRLIAVFQPHRYSRTQLLLDEFARSFDCADYVIVTDIYPAGEAPIADVSGSRVCEKIRELAPGKPVAFMHKQEIVPEIMKIIRPKDLVITLGAGDIVKVSDELAECVKGQGQAERAARPAYDF